MTPLTFVLLSGTLSFGVPLALAIREMLKLSTSRPDGDSRPPEEPFPKAPKPLPVCLLPAPEPIPDPLRVLKVEHA